MALLRRGPFDREILRLAVPALGALAADPLVSLVDTAFVGRLGAAALGSLAVAAAVFGVAFALFNFLAYGTTPLVARRIGEGRSGDASRIASAAVLVGLVLGVLSAVVLIASAPSILRVMGASDETLGGATTYLRIRALALPAVMVVTAGHGIFRGLQDTRTPFVITAGLNVVNLVLDPILIFAADLGLAGAAWATLIAQGVGGLWFALSLLRRGRRMGLVWRVPQRRDLRNLLGAGRALVLRTGSLLAALTLATAVAARIGTSAVAAHQVMFQIWIFLSLVLDALAIAGQAMIGGTLTRDREAAAAMARRLLGMGLVFGLGLAAVLAAVGPWLPGWFTDDAGVVGLLRDVYPFLILMQPLNALVFVWDGIVIGATGFAFLAWSTLGSAAAAVVVLALVLPMGWSLAGVWWSIVALMLGRAGSLTWWHLRGPLSAGRGPFPASRAA